MSILDQEEQHLTADRLQAAGLTVYFTLTVPEGFDLPTDLRNLGWQFINNIQQAQGKAPRFWFAVCQNTGDDRDEDSLYHIHGFLGGLDGIKSIQQLDVFWRRSYRKRDRKTGTRRKHTASLGRTDFQPLTGNRRPFDYVAAQVVMRPCTNIQELKPDVVTKAVAVECGEFANA